MSTSIFDTNEYVNATYKLNDFVNWLGGYYYCIVPHTATFFNSPMWGGTIVIASLTKPHFIWKPSYNGQTDLTPKVKNIQLGDGYLQSLPDGINNTLLKFNINFNGRDLDETTAILHFLKQRGGSESFVFTPYVPFGQRGFYRCQSYSSEYIFLNNYNISAVFTQAAN